MTEARCSCGFTELAEESLTDHLLDVFTPEGNQGNDGLIHEEMTLLTCRCGYAAESVADLDDHFLEAFIPIDGIGRDGQDHEVTSVDPHE